MSEQRFFWGALAERKRAEEKNHRGTEGTERCATSASVPSVPLWFKHLEKRGSVRAL